MGDRVTAVLGLASTVLKGLLVSADRVIMNLSSPINYLPAATEMIKDGGLIHLHTVDILDSSPKV